MTSQVMLCDGSATTEKMSSAKQIAQIIPSRKSPGVRNRVLRYNRRPSPGPATHT